MIQLKYAIWRRAKIIKKRWEYTKGKYGLQIKVYTSTTSNVPPYDTIPPAGPTSVTWYYADGYNFLKETGLFALDDPQMVAFAYTQYEITPEVLIGKFCCEGSPAEQTMYFVPSTAELQTRQVTGSRTWLYSEDVDKYTAV